MKGSVVYIAVFFIGCLIVLGQCRHEPESTYQAGHANATTLISPLEESKITLKWCLPRDCHTKGEPVRTWNAECICCVTLPDVPCYHTTEECMKKCPTK
ncbi:hypothetical protein ZWY2020_023251 [Hordeum vulgare]|nr:hypothetical protein ZWY2020_023251 [Hordeum vulgare]